MNIGGGWGDGDLCGFGDGGDGSGHGNQIGGDHGEGYGDGEGYGIGDGNSTSAWPARRPEHYRRDGSGDGGGWSGAPTFAVVASSDDVAGQVLLATWRCA